MNRKTIKNLSRLIQLLFTCPILWFGTFGENQICQNFIIFFNVLVGILCLSIIFAKEKFLETANDPQNYYINDYILMLTWMLPACILVGGGWIWSGILWFFTWALCNHLNKELKEKIEREDRIKEFKGE